MRQFKPDAIMLDIRLPGMDGWTVLDRFTKNTRHIPVHMISVELATAQSATGAIASAKARHQ